MTRLLIVGSGASGVHLAITALERGFEVCLVDVGYERPQPVAPTATYGGLKTSLDDPVAYFLGPNGEGVVYPATKASYYGHPPSKQYVFARPREFTTRSIRMEPLFSFARGGLAEAWTAGCYEFSPEDLAPFPVDYGAMKAAYQEVARRIGVGGERDDLARFIPFHADYLQPLPLDLHSTLITERYAARRDELQRTGFHLGRSRVATVSTAYRGRIPCGQLGRCLWGCPTDSIYSPAVTLRECLTKTGFRYLPNLLASHFECDARGRVIALLARERGGGPLQRVDADLFALAAGALASSKLFLETLYRRDGRVASLGGLMDNRQVHVPFLTPAMIGKPVETASYQFHHLAFGLERADPTEYVHGQITTLKSASVHPIVQSLPLDYRGSLAAFRSLRAGLGIANINLHDRRRTESRLTLRPIPDGDYSELVIEYADDPEESGAITTAAKQVKQALGRLGCLVPPGMTRVLPKGASVHYAGTVPMSAEAAPLACSPSCQSYDLPNLYFADGASFPFLPSKNLTFTLMANAVRVARELPRNGPK